MYDFNWVFVRKNCGTNLLGGNLILETGGNLKGVGCRQYFSSLNVAFYYLRWEIRAKDLDL